VNGTPTSATTLNTGSGADTVNVLATNGPLAIDGQGGRDAINIGNNGRVESIGPGLTVANSGSGGYSDVNIDDSKDSKSTDRARTVIVYSQLVQGNSVTTISGFPTGGDINLISGNLRSLTISAGDLGNTFRIHDTPNSLTPGGVKTTVNTGAGADNVTVDGTTGRLDLNVQGGTGVGNQISVGSATVNLDTINGPINITGVSGAVSALTVNDTASITSHQFVVDRDFVQRGGRARIGYQNMSQLTLRTAAQPDHIIVQDTAVFGFNNGTSITAGGNDLIDVLKTTGTLFVSAGGTSAINIGSAANSLDNIQGVIGVTPSGGSQVTLSLDDETATTTQQLDVVANFFGFPAFQRSGAAVINLLSGSLYKLNWQSGSGGTDLHEYVKAAQLTNYILGNDTLTIGTKSGTVSNFGLITVTGGVGPDAVILNDSGETRPQIYSVSQVSGGHEVFATRLTTVDLGPDIETFEVKGGSGGNIINVEGTIARMSTIIHAGAGVNTVNVGASADSLQAIQGPLTIDGAGGTNTLIFDDQGTTTQEYYDLTADALRRTDTNVVPDMAPISLSGVKAVTLNTCSGDSLVNVFGSAAGSTVTVNGQAGSLDTFVARAEFNAILGPVVFNGQAEDFALYNDAENTAPHSYTLTSTTVGREDLAPMFFSGPGLVLLQTPVVGGNTVGVNSTSLDSFLSMYVANGDQVTIGSLAPGLGGTLADILAGISVGSYTPDDAVSLVLDDSGDADLTPKNVTLTPTDRPEDYGRVEDFAPSTIYWSLGRNSSIALVGGQGSPNSLTFNDLATTTRENYSLTTDHLSRVEATGVTEDMAPVSFSGFEAITLNVGSGGSSVAVYGSAAGCTVTVNGQAGSQDEFAVNASTNAILGPIYLNGQSAEGDFAQYYDIANASPHTYTLSSTSVNRDDQAPVFTNVGTTLYGPMVGGNTFNVTSVALGGAFKIQAANGDHVTVGSLAPGLGGTLDDILDQVNVVSYTADDDVTVVFDDSGNTDTTPKHATFVGPDGDGNVSVLGLTPIALSWNLPLASSVTILGGAADTTYSMHPIVAQTPVTIVGGSGVNTLDYSDYDTGVTVNLATGKATDLAGIRDPNTGRITIQNVIGGSGNDTLTAGAARSILIGGGGVDQLVGGSGEDILIGGTTDYTQGGLNAAAFDAIIQEWNRTDLGFDDRMSDLLTGSNAQGIAANNVIAGTAVLLDSTTVHDDLAADVLTGGTGRDWYFIDISDLIANQKPGDAVTLV
jgi:hypothetical protein